MEQHLKLASEESLERPTKRAKVVVNGLGSESKEEIRARMERKHGSKDITAKGWGSNFVSPYDSAMLHKDLENDNFAGVYGGNNSAYFGLAELRAGTDMLAFHKKKTKDEYLLPELARYFANPHTQRRWSDIVTIDPWGFTATRPTMAATFAVMQVPELKGAFPNDGKVVVTDDSDIKIRKMAVDLVWNIPRLSERLGFEENIVREKLYKYTQNDRVRDPKYNAFLPPVGGATVYVFGDVEALSNPATEVAVRVHDQCTGSDVFGTDICTCRPYLVFAIKACVDCAQRGGVGIIVYFQKEGRSLGEVTKFRVYNARKNQEGGDVAEKYFFQTESIAGVRDARFQEMMPDLLLLMGITRIDWLLSMSSEKYDAITDAGIEVMQRVALPDHFVPAGAQVEITAKISAGYHTDTIESGEVVSNLRNLEMVRERCEQIYNRAQRGAASYFILDESKLDFCADYVLAVIKSNYPDMNIPYHSRWRHFLPGTVESMVATWHCEPIEKARRLLDLVTISVLLDAGSGPSWKYTDAKMNVYNRSEGIAIATLDMFNDGIFSSDAAMKHRVNGLGLKNLTVADFSRGFQISATNPMNGVQGRFKLLTRLADAMDKHPEYFGHEMKRPGNIVDYVMKNCKADKTVSFRVLWEAIIVGLESIWPNTLSGIRRGDIWVYNPLKEAGRVGSDMVPFHKLSQWLSLSLLEPIEELGVKFVDLELITGLAEYRNGGLMVDAGVLRLRKAEHNDMLFDVGSELVVEWRALTVCLLDRLTAVLQRKTGLSPTQLSLPKVLQGGTWAAGRRIAAEKRPGGTPPINIRSDGSVF